MRTLRTTSIGLTLLCLLATAAACTGSGPRVAGPTPTLYSAPAATTPYSPAPGSCPVTLPQPVPSSEPWATQLFGSSSAYGNDQLWVGGLGTGGMIEATPDPDGSIGWK